MHNTSTSHAQSQWRGTLLVTLSGMLYGMIGYLGTKLMDEDFTVSSMLFWRFLIAAVWMLVSISLFKREKPLTNNSSKLMNLILFGALTYSGGSAFYFVATQYIGTGVGMVIFFSFPVYVTLFAWALSGWKMSLQAFISLMAVVLGLFFLKGHGDAQLNVIGILFALAAAFCYGVYVYGSRHSAKMIDSRLLTLLICLGNTIIFLIVACMSGSFVFPMTLKAWFYICALGILATAIPIQLLLDGLKYISPVKASILSVFEPVITVLLGLILLDEKLTFMQTMGILIVLSGAILIQFERTAESSNKKLN